MIEARGRGALEASGGALDCGNSGTTMRLVAGVLASRPFHSVLIGDTSLSRRPMERVAAPLRSMGARVSTADGHPPLEITGGSLRGVVHTPAVPSAQVKGCVLLAGLDADGETVVRERVGTRDHTERALRHLGGPVRVEPGSVSVRRFAHDGFSATVPGDASSAAFLIAATALTRGRLEIAGVGLNPTRTRFLSVLERMGVKVEARIEAEELGEPVGTLAVDRPGELRGTIVGPGEAPLVIDEVPVLAMLAAHARGESRFEGAGELRVKESDRLRGTVDTIRRLGGDAAVDGDAVVVAGGGLRGGTVACDGDHRMAMAAAVAAFGADGPVTLDGIEAADVSFPGFARTLRTLGARIEAV